MDSQRGFITNNLRSEKIAQQDKRNEAEKKMEALLTLEVLKRQSPAVDSH
jgi:hypothetical protein